MYTFTQEDLEDLLLRVDKNVAKYSNSARESMKQTILSFFRKHQSWISVDDELPKDEMMVQVGHSSEGYVAEAQYKHGKWYEGGDPRFLLLPTHWKYISLPPV